MNRFAFCIIIWSSKVSPFEMHSEKNSWRTSWRGTWSDYKFLINQTFLLHFNELYLYFRSLDHSLSKHSYLIRTFAIHGDGFRSTRLCGWAGYTNKSLSRNHFYARQSLSLLYGNYINGNDLSLSLLHWMTVYGAGDGHWPFSNIKHISHKVRIDCSIHTVKQIVQRLTIH